MKDRVSLEPAGQEFVHSYTLYLPYLPSKFEGENSLWGPMNDSGTWNLLMLSTTSLTITVTLLLWFVTNYLDLLQQAEKTDSPSEQMALSKSIRVVIIITSIVLILAAGLLSGYVAWINLSVISVVPWTLEFVLLGVSLAVPIIGALISCFVMIENIGLRSIVAAYRSFLLRFHQEPVDLNAVMHLSLIDKPSEKAFPIGAATYQDWQHMRRWLEKNESRWGMGKGFIKANHKVFLALVDAAWQDYQKVSPYADELPLRLVPSLAEALEALNVNYAVVRRRPLAIAKVACLVYAESMKN